MTPGLTRTILPPGTRVCGAFIVDRLVRHGPLASVYSARKDGDPMPRHAVRVVHRELAPGGTLPPTAQRALERLKGLQHRGIPPVVATAAEAHGLVVVTEHSGGVSLRDILARGEQLEGVEVERIAASVAAVLDDLHHRQPPVVHRGLCPENLILDRDGRVWVEECGLVHALSEAGLIAGQGVPVAMQAYLSPDELLHRADPRTDTFVLASVVYECLTGAKAFKGGSAAALERAILRGPRPLATELRGDLFPLVDEVLARAWSVDQGSAFPSASGFVVELSRALSPTSAPPAASSYKPRSAHPESRPPASLDPPEGSASEPAVSNGPAFDEVDLAFDAMLTLQGAPEPVPAPPVASAAPPPSGEQRPVTAAPTSRKPPPPTAPAAVKAAVAMRADTPPKGSPRPLSALGPSATRPVQVPNIRRTMVGQPPAPGTRPASSGGDRASRPPAHEDSWEPLLSNDPGARGAQQGQPEPGVDASAPNEAPTPTPAPTEPAVQLPRAEANEAGERGEAEVPDAPDLIPVVDEREELVPGQIPVPVAPVARAVSMPPPLPGSVFRAASLPPPLPAGLQGARASSPQAVPPAEGAIASEPRPEPPRREEPSIQDEPLVVVPPPIELPAEMALTPPPILLTPPALEEPPEAFLPRIEVQPPPVESSYSEGVVSSPRVELPPAGGSRFGEAPLRHPPFSAPPAPPPAPPRSITLGIVKILGASMVLSVGIVTAGQVYLASLERPREPPRVVYVRVPVNAHGAPSTVDAATEARADAATGSSGTEPPAALVLTTAPPATSEDASAPPTAQTAPTTEPPTPTPPPPGTEAAGHPGPHDVEVATAALLPEVRRCVGDRDGRRLMRVTVRYQGETGTATRVDVHGSWDRRPVGPCVSSAVRGRPMPRFSDDHWDMDFVFPVR